MFTLITLPYPATALEPIISAQTLSFHHGKHLQGYVNNLNALLPGSPFEGLPLEEIVRRSGPSGDGAAANPAVFNNAGQILNHNLYFTQFKTPDQVGGDGGVQVGGDGGVQTGSAGNVISGSGPAPVGALAAQIAHQWGTFEAFQAEFVAKGTSLFGSGWVWLSAEADGTLVISQEPGAHNPIEKGRKPLLTFDVWEHAYYLDYQNRRADHLKALWEIVNWEEIERRYGDAGV